MRTYSSPGLGGNGALNAFVDFHVKKVRRTLGARRAWPSRVMDSQSQFRKIIALIHRKLDSNGSWFDRINFESCGAAVAKPRRRLTSGGEPCAATLKLLDQVTIKFAPQSFRGEAAVVPVDRKRASKSDGIFQHWAKERLRLPWRKCEVAGVEQSCVHDVKRQLEQPSHSERLIDLRSPSAISHRFIVAGR